jgi:RimJ/RimL family protein N-acetyltransferase
MKYGFESLELKPILGITSKKNIASQNLLIKIGLKENGEVKPEEEKEELLLFSTS